LAQAIGETRATFDDHATMTDIDTSIKSVSTTSSAGDFAASGLHGKGLSDVVRKEKGLIGFDGQDAEWCPYTETSQNYDKTRRPLGVGITLGAFGQTQTQKLLDIGSGTGTFLAVVHDRFASATGLEYNSGMIEQAQQRLQGAKNVTYVQGSAHAMPFEDGAFDAATMNQVTHHFPNDDDFAFHKTVCAEAYRVLKPGGCLVINHMTRVQAREGYWWGGCLPRATEECCKKTVPTEQLLRYLREAGFTIEDESLVVPTHGTLMSPETYLAQYGIEGAFVKEYRDGDSTWAVAEAIGELPEAQAMLRQLQAEGKDAAWLAEREEMRKKVGQATFFIARK